MSKSRCQPRRRRRTNFVQKPNGSLAPRVQAVGPERFGITMVDVSKERIQTQICDFYGNETVPFTVYEQSRPGCAACLRSIEQVQADARVLDLVIAIERTGEYHRPFQRAAQRAHHVPHGRLRSAKPPRRG
jgi:transposase